MSRGRFVGQLAVITGVNDRGIGSAIAEQLAEEGAKVVLMWFEQPTRLIRRFEKAGYDFVDLPCDVTSQSSVDHALCTVREQCGPVDILINNAGVDHSGDLEATSDDQWQQVVDVNLTGSMRMIRSTLADLKEQQGAVVNLASVLGLAGCGGFSSYSAAKAGVIGLTQSLAMELAPFQARAVCVAPALVATPMLQKYLQDIGPDFYKNASASHPLGVGTPQDVASAVAFVASREARWITGITLPLGWSASFPLPMQPFLGNQHEQPTDSPATLSAIPYLSETDSASGGRIAS